MVTKTNRENAPQYPKQKGFGFIYTLEAVRKLPQIDQEIASYHAQTKKELQFLDKVFILNFQKGGVDCKYVFLKC